MAGGGCSGAQRFFFTYGSARQCFRWLVRPSGVHTPRRFNLSGSNQNCSRRWRVAPLAQGPALRPSWPPPESDNDRCGSCRAVGAGRRTLDDGAARRRSGEKLAGPWHRSSRPSHRRALGCSQCALRRVGGSPSAALTTRSPRAVGGWCRTGMGAGAERLDHTQASPATTTLRS